MSHLKDRYRARTRGRSFILTTRGPSRFASRISRTGFRCSADSLAVCRFLFSVAEHSIAVANLLPANLKLFGLLHDASEAYLADLPRPVKAGLPEYRAIETNVERVIAEKFELPFPMPPEVKAADQALLKDEVFSFSEPSRISKISAKSIRVKELRRLLGD